MSSGAFSTRAQNLTEGQQTGGFSEKAEIRGNGIDKESRRPLSDIGCSSATKLPCLPLDQIRELQINPSALGVECSSTTKLPCLTRNQIRELQINLSALGFDSGPVDGIFGPRTLQALDAFRSAEDLSEYGYPQISEVRRINRIAQTKQNDSQLSREQSRSTDNRQIGVEGLLGGIAVGAAVGNIRKASPQSNSAPVGRRAVPTPTRTFAGPGQFPPTGFRGYGFVAFPARAGEFDFERHMMICQAYMNSLPTISAVRQSHKDKFVTVWPLTNRDVADKLNRQVHRSEVAAACKRAINGYDVNRAREVIRMVRQSENATFEGRGPFLFGWIPADGFGEAGKLILLLDLSRVTTYEQALTQLQSWQQRVETNPELLRDGFSIENLRRLIRDWSDQHGQAFLLLIGAG